jgi:aprataxin
MSNTKKPKPKPKPSKPSDPLATVFKHKFSTRDGLGVYTEHPEKNPEGRVLEWDDDFVVIQDKYPKSSVHLLLLLRDPEINTEHPLAVLSAYPELLEKVKTRVEPVKRLAAEELRRLYGRVSASDAAYQQALEDLMSSPDPPTTQEERDALLPPGRDWLSEIRVGVHTHPSMTHIHIHVLSRDMQGACLNHPKHYRSFNTSFLVGLDEFPIELDSQRSEAAGWSGWDMKCWRCGRNFGNKFTALERHSLEEFEVWKRL